MNNAFPAIVVVILVIAAFASIALRFSRSESLLEQWAEENGFEILHSEYRNFFRGPFFLTTSKSQTVYYVRVRDLQGVERAGWVRCGGWFLGLMSDQAEVSWEDENNA